MLPKIDYPTFTDILPSTGEKITFRPFLVKEEKILLLAQQSNEVEDSIRAMSQIIGNCVLSKINIDDLPIFDIEYLFLKLRAKSVNNIVELKYKDNEDNKVYDFALDLDDIKVTKDPANNKNIQITDTIGIVMKYPNFKMMMKFTEFDENDPDEVLEVVSECIDSIYNDDSVYKASEHTTEEMKEFLSSLSLQQMEKIYDFFQSLPKIEHTINYINSLGNNRSITLEGVNDFFQ